MRKKAPGAERSEVGGLVEEEEEEEEEERSNRLGFIAAPSIPVFFEESPSPTASEKRENLEVEHIMI